MLSTHMQSCKSLKLFFSSNVIFFYTKSLCDVTEEGWGGKIGYVSRKKPEVR
jgi:hypothetical protein